MTKNLKHIVNNILDAKKQASWHIHIMDSWPTIMGKLHDKSCVTNVYKDTITVGVFESSWMQELYMLSKEIIKKVNTLLQEQKIKHIKFKHISRKKKKKEKKEIVQYYQKRPLTKAEQRALKEVKDGKLSKALEDFLIRCSQQ